MESLAIASSLQLHIMEAGFNEPLQKAIDIELNLSTVSGDRHNWLGQILFFTPPPLLLFAPSRFHTKSEIACILTHTSIMFFLLSFLFSDFPHLRVQLRIIVTMG